MKRIVLTLAFSVSFQGAAAQDAAQVEIAEAVGQFNAFTSICGFDPAIDYVAEWQAVNLIDANDPSIIAIKFDRENEVRDILLDTSLSEVLRLCEQYRVEYSSWGFLIADPTTRLGGQEASFVLEDFDGVDTATYPEQSNALSVLLEECPGIVSSDAEIKVTDAIVYTPYAPDLVGKYGQPNEWTGWYEFSFEVVDPPKHLPRMAGHHFGVQISPSPREIVADKTIGAWACDLPIVDGEPYPRRIDATTVLTPLPVDPA